MAGEAVPEEGDKFVENAGTPEPTEGASPAPEEKAAEGQKPEGTPEGETELSGDENADEVEQFLRKKHGKLLGENDLQKFLGWRRQGVEGGKTATRLKELESSSKKGLSSDQALRSLASSLGAGYVEKLQELGPEEFAKFATDPNYGQSAEAAKRGLNPNDPKDAMLQQLLDWKAKTEEGQAKEAQQKAFRERSARFSDGLTAAVEKLGLKSDSAKAIVWRLADSLYAQAGHVPGDPDSPEIAPFAKQAKEMLDAHGTVVSGNEEDAQEQATPKIPDFAAAKETPGRERPEDDDDEDAAEERGFVARATSGKGG